MSTPIMNQYNQIKKEHQDFLLFFRLGDFYELFFEDAKIAAEILGITLTRRVQKDEEIPMAGVPFHTCDYYLAKLVKAGKKIAICEQISPPDAKNKIIERAVTRIITPGTLVDDSLLTPNRNNFLVAIFEQNLQISAAIFDLSTNEFFIENLPTQDLKNFLEKNQPSEILVVQNFIPNFPDYNSWKNSITLAPEIDSSYAAKNITKFFGLHSLESLNWMKQIDLISCSMILDYLNLTQKYEINQNNREKVAFPKRRIAQNEVYLDKFTRRNLEITKTLQNEHFGSLLWLLDNTKTAQGGRAMFTFINNPINDLKILTERQKKIEFFMQDRRWLEKITTNLKTIPDFERILGKIILKRCTPPQLRTLAIGITNLHALFDLIKKPIEDFEIEILANKIIAAISDNIENKEKGIINDGFDPELDSWKTFERQIDDQIYILQEEYKKDTKIANLRIKFTANFGYAVEINSQHKDKLSYNFTLQQELKTTARYMTSALMQINQKFAESSEIIIQKEREIFEKLCAEILQKSEIINKYSEISAQIDLFSNCAKIALENGYVRPELTTENDFEITDGRHPVLDKIMSEKGENFVPNDCNLEKCVMFMTGPNMAGKSTYLRQQALISFLAHLGMYVPAKHAKIGLIDHIFSRIGANDNLIEGNSTFMMEMIEIALTLNQANQKSFIVFDEVGRGTSVEEGMAIAQAILEYLVQNLGARALFSTHYLALAKIENPNLQKKMMEITETEDLFGSKIHFTHKILDGVAKKSYAISVAKLAGMPDKIVQRAENLLK